MNRILIADDHAIVRRGLVDILVAELKGAIYTEAENARQVLEKVQTQNWDLVVLDVTMPGRSGLDVLVEIKRARPKLPVLILSMHPEDQMAKRAFKAGASGYINKASAADELVKAIRKLLAGGRYVSSALAEKLTMELADDSDRPLHENLSPREFEVLRLIALGKTVKQIGEECNLTSTTISTYRTRVLEKMKMTTSSELMHYAVRNRIVE